MSPAFSGLVAPGPRMFPQPYSPQGVWYRKITGATVATDTDPTSGRLYSENMRLSMSAGTTPDGNGVYGTSAVGSLAGGPNHSGDGKPIFIVPTPDHPRQPVFHFGSFPNPALGQLPTSWVTGQTYKGIGLLTGVNGTPGGISQGTIISSIQVDSLQQAISGLGQDVYVLSPDGTSIDHYTSGAAVSVGQTNIPINNAPSAGATFPTGSIVFHNPFSGMIQYFLQSVPVPVGLDANNKISFSSVAFQVAHTDRIVASGGTDAAMTIWDPWHDELWEFAKFFAGNITGTVIGPLTTGSPQTSFQANLTYPLPAGTYTLRDTADANTDTITVTTPAAAGSNVTVTISSHTFTFAFPTGSLIGAANQSIWTDNAHPTPPPGYLTPFNDGWYYACANAAYWGSKLVTMGGLGVSSLTSVNPRLPYTSTNQDTSAALTAWGCSALDAPRDLGRINAMDIKRGRIDHALKIFGQCGGPNGPSGVATTLSSSDSGGHPMVAACPSGQPTVRWDSTGSVETQGAQQLFVKGPALTGNIGPTGVTSLPVGSWPASFGQVGGPNYSGALSGAVSSIPIVQLKCPLGGVPASPVSTIFGTPPTFPTGTISVANASVFPPIGSVTIQGVTGDVAYTGRNTNLNTLTGCTGGTGTPVANAPVRGLYTITDGTHTDTFCVTAQVNDGATSVQILQKTFSFAFTNGTTLAWPAILGGMSGRMSTTGDGTSGTAFSLKTVSSNAGPNGNSSVNNGDATIAIQSKNLNFSIGNFVEISDLRYETPEGSWYRLDPKYILPTAGDTFNQTGGAKYPELAGNLGTNPVPTAIIDPMHVMFWQAMQQYGFLVTDGGAPSTFSGWDINTADTPYEVTTSVDWNTRVTALAPNSIATNTSAVGSQSFVWVAGSSNQANQKNPCWTGPWLPATAARFSDGRTPAATTLSGGAQTLPEATVTVTSTAGFPQQGFLFIVGVTGAVTYTGISGNTFTGCYGGTGSPATNAAVAQGYSCVQQVVFGTW